MPPKLLPRIARYSTQSRLAGALLDFISGVDPSGIGLAQALFAFLPRRGT